MPYDGITVLFIRGGRDTIVLSPPHEDMTFLPVTMEAEAGGTKLQANGPHSMDHQEPPEARKSQGRTLA